MNRRAYLKTAGVAASAGLVAGCSGSANGDSTPTYGTLATSVTDMPGDIADFESCVVTMAGIWVKPAASDETDTETEGSTEADTTTAASATGTEDGDGRRYIEFEEPQTADLVDLQGSNTQSLGETELETGSYQYLQLDVTGVEATLDGGGEASVETPGNAPLKFNAEFEIRAAERTHFIADFTPVERGNGSYLIQPVASGTAVLYGDAAYTAEDASGTETDGTSAGAEVNASASAEVN